MTVQSKRLDRLISRLVTVANTVRSNPEIEFDVDKLLTVCEVAIDALDTEIDDELEAS